MGGSFLQVILCISLYTLFYLKCFGGKAGGGVEGWEVGLGRGEGWREGIGVD